MYGTPLETSAGTAGLEKPDLDKAKTLLRESGYDGRTVIFMQPSDLSANVNATVVVAEAMRKAGFKVQRSSRWTGERCRSAATTRARSPPTRQQGRLRPAIDSASPAPGMILLRIIPLSP
jgi:hypothetical protein